MQDWTGASQPRTPGTEAAPEAWTDPPSGPPRGAKPAAALDFLPDFLRLRARPLLSPDTRVSLVCLLPTPCGRAPSPTAQTLVAPDLPSAGTRSVFWKLGGGGGGGSGGGLVLWREHRWWSGTDVFGMPASSIRNAASLAKPLGL